METETTEPTDPFDTSGLPLKLRLRFAWADVKHNIKNYRPNWEKFIIRLFIWLALISMAIGLIIFIVYLVKLSHRYTISGNNNIEIDKTGEVGDFIGGTVGAIWSLTGSLLFYATLRLQSRELIESRKQFETSRITDILYKQLEFFHSQTEQFELKSVEADEAEPKTYKGKDALNLIRVRMNAILDTKDEPDTGKGHQEFMSRTIAFLRINMKELAHIYSELSNHTGIVQTVLIKEDIPAVELNELKSIFFKNIGEDFLHASEHLGMMMDMYILVMEKAEEQKFDKLFSTEHKLIRSIDSIKSFRLKNYDKETIKKDLKNREFRTRTHF